MTMVKICGISDLESGLAAIDAGAEYLGFVFYPPSTRFVEPLYAADLIAALRHARPTGWQAVGVFVNEPLDLVDLIRRICALDVVQLNGEEPPSYVRQVQAPKFKSVRFHSQAVIPTAAELGAERILLDANVPGRYGGTGVSYEWSAVRAAAADGFLAGGLTPANVSRAIAEVHPWGVDVSSGVEQDGRKSPPLIRQFVAAVRAVDRAGAGPTLGSVR